MTERNRTIALLIAAAVCFTVATLIAVDAIIHGGNYSAWIGGGLIALALALISEKLP